MICFLILNPSVSQVGVLWSLLSSTKAVACKHLSKTTSENYWLPKPLEMGDIVLKQLAHVLPCTNSFIVKRQSQAPVRVVSPPLQWPTWPWVAFASWVLGPVVIIFLPIGQWMVLCFASVTIKLALCFEKLPIFISAPMRSKSKAGEWGNSHWWKFMFSAQEPRRPEGLRVTLHSPPPNHSTWKIL